MLKDVVFVHQFITYYSPIENGYYSSRKKNPPICYYYGRNNLLVEINEDLLNMHQTVCHLCSNCELAGAIAFTIPDINHGDNNEDTETNINNNEIVEITQTNNVIMPTVETYQPIDNNQNNQSLNNIHRKDELVIIPMQEQEIIITASEDEPATIPTIFAHQNSKGKWTNQEVGILLKFVLDKKVNTERIKQLGIHRTNAISNKARLMK
ncbi:17791_t:CDS:2 [Entrophospora sp. SA101]|nr:17791_t:CDS:2 [Entrophospora sp. SA101]